MSFLNDALKALCAESARLNRMPALENIRNLQASEIVEMYHLVINMSSLIAVLRKQIPKNHDLPAQSILYGTSSLMPIHLHNWGGHFESCTATHAYKEV